MSMGKPYPTQPNHSRESATLPAVAWGLVGLIALTTAVVELVFAHGYNRLSQDFRGCRTVSHFDTGPLAICAAPRLPWRIAWPKLHHLNA
ncbi:MAG TPA: hypothetical protein VH247_08645 [Thermoleophilaceae bacterium]|nr:hypothetical protein [Thermoleophilaceae bacterium]